MTEEDEAFEQMALKQGHWQHPGGNRKRQIAHIDVHSHPPQRTEQEPVELPCCGYTDASAIKWNSFNGVVQCHNCGQTYTPPQRTEPPQKKVWTFWDLSGGDIADAIKAKLKEKNT